jgi:hypothetical protein
MGIGPLVNIAGGYLQSLLAPGKSNGSSPSTANGAANGGHPASSFAQMLHSLQQLQQSNASRFSQVTQQIAANLQTASQTAQTNGNTVVAGQLNTLAGDFTSASKNGQLPNVLDLAKAIGGHHHHHYSIASPSSNGASGSATPDVSALLAQIYGSFQTGGPLNASTDPKSIILNTLSTAGV